MNDLIFHEPFLKAMKDLPRLARKALYDFAKFPSDGNQSYMIGYMGALRDNSVISCDTHTYMLSVCGQLTKQAYISEAIKHFQEANV